MRSILVVLLVLGVPAAEAAGLSTQQRAWLDEHGPVRYAPDPSYPPFEFATGSGVDGINVDLLNRMSRQMGFEYEVVTLDNWTAVLEAMQQGDIDLIGSVAKTGERDMYMDFSTPYLQVGQVFYGREGGPSSENDLSRVAVIGGYASAEWLADNRPHLELVEVADVRSGVETLITGEVDAFFASMSVTGYHIRQSGLTGIRVIGTPLYYSDMHWAVPQDQEVLLSIVEAGMAQVPPGERTAIFEYWSGHDLSVQVDDRTAPTWLRPFAWGLVVLVAIAAVWIGSLRSTVRRRTGDLERLNTRLEQRVAERTAELEEVNRHLDAFASSVSHDLKQPLSVVAMQSRIASLQAKKGQPVDLTSLDRQVERMQQFIQALLEFSRASRPGERQDVDVAQLVEDVCTTLEPQWGPREISVRSGLKAHADPVLLRTIMQNLLGNAWKFTADQVDARIEVGGDGERFFVRDNGPGFDAKGMGDRLFKPFERGDGTNGIDGTGIGLATVARIVRAHGGKVWADSRPGHGATIWWTLPRSKAARAA